MASTKALAGPSRVTPRGPVLYLSRRVRYSTPAIFEGHSARSRSLNGSRRLSKSRIRSLYPAFTRDQSAVVLPLLESPRNRTLVKRFDWCSARLGKEHLRVKG